MTFAFDWDVKHEVKQKLPLPCLPTVFVDAYIYGNVCVMVYPRVCFKHFVTTNKFKHVLGHALRSKCVAM